MLTDENRILTTTTMDSMGRFEALAPTAAEIADLEKTITNLLPSQDAIQVSAFSWNFLMGIKTKNIKNNLNII